MIHYEIDPIVNTVKSNLSDSISESPKDISMNSRISNILQSNKPSEVVVFCSQFKNNIHLYESFEDKNEKNNSSQHDIIYNENDIIEILNSLKVAETNLQFEKEFDSVVNYLVMKEINPTKVENKITPNLRRLKTDPLFRTHVDAILLNYKPIQFDLINFYITKHDIGVQSPKEFSKKFKGSKNLNNCDDISNSSSFFHQNSDQPKKYFIENDFKRSTPQIKHSFIFLSESDSENNDKFQDFTPKVKKIRRHKSTTDHQKSKYSDYSKSKKKKNDIDSDIYSSDTHSYSNYYSEMQSESSKENLTKRKNHHKYTNHHSSNDSKVHKHHHSHKNTSNLSQSRRLIEIEQESSSELKSDPQNKRNQPKLHNIDIEDSLNMIIETSSNFESMSSQNDEQKSKKQKIDIKNSDLDPKEEDFFEIEFENEVGVEEEELKENE